MAFPVVNALWIGSTLGARHAACLSSFVAVGHRVVLHVYGEPPVDLPYGVETADASKLMPFEKLPRHKRTGSYALASDLFRYEVLAAELGLYVDCDVFALKPIPDEDYIFGFESAHEINGAVLKLPADSPILADLRSIGASKTFIPPWLSERKQRKLRWRAFFGRAPDISEMHWGIAGPIAITYFAKKHGVYHLAKAPDVFYPLHYSRAYQLLEDGLALSEMITPRTVAFHLYNESLGWRGGELQPNSPLSEIIRSHRRRQAK